MLARALEHRLEIGCQEAGLRQDPEWCESLLKERARLLPVLEQGLRLARIRHGLAGEAGGSQIALQGSAMVIPGPAANHLEADCLQVGGRYRGPGMLPAPEPGLQVRRHRP